MNRDSVLIEVCDFVAANCATFLLTGKPPPGLVLRER
jgi:hypothetical protein